MLQVSDTAMGYEFSLFWLCSSVLVTEVAHLPKRQATKEVQWANPSVNQMPLQSELHLICYTWWVLALQSFIAGFLLQPDRYDSSEWFLSSPLTGSELFLLKKIMICS